MPLFLDHPQQQLAIALAGTLIDLALCRRHVHIEQPFAARGQFGGHLFLGAAQDKGVDQLAQQVQGLLVLVAFDGGGESAPKVFEIAEQARIEEGKLRPEFEGIVLHRRAGEH
jgi:hypothetical protein